MCVPAQKRHAGWGDGEGRLELRAEPWRETLVPVHNNKTTLFGSILVVRGGGGGGGGMYFAPIVQGVVDDDAIVGEVES
jgi:hypothetical protein